MNLVTIVTNMALQGKYFFLFIIYLIEGPIAGFISAMIASTGQLNIYIVALLLISGEIAADVMYYFLGRNLSQSKMDKKLGKFKKIIGVVKGGLDKHPIRILAFAKTVGFIAVPVILMIGRCKSLKCNKFFLWTSIICLAKDLTILFLGYGLGVSLEVFLSGYDIYKIVGIIMSLLVILYILYRANIDKIENFTIKSLKRIK